MTIADIAPIEHIFLKDPYDSAKSGAFPEEAGREAHCSIRFADLYPIPPAIVQPSDLC